MSAAENRLRTGIDEQRKPSGRLRISRTIETIKKKS